MPETEVPTCSYIRETGEKCNAVALKGRDHCRFHDLDHRRRQQLKSYRGKGEPHVIEAMDLPQFETPEDLQICLSNLFQAVAARRVNPEDADRLLQILRVASRNFRTMHAFNKDFYKWEAEGSKHTSDEELEQQSCE